MCGLAYSNIIIGQNSKGEIIGIVDKEFDGIVENEEVITVIPDNWSQGEKENLHPVFFVSLDSKNNDLQCKVRNVYYGRIACNTSHKIPKYEVLPENVIVANSNSVVKELYVEVNSASQTEAIFKVLDMTGKIAISIRNDLKIGNNQILINVGELARGMYMLKVTNGKELNYAQTFQKK